MLSNQNEAALDDRPSLDRLQKDVEAVKADISKLTRQVTSVINDLAELAQRRARRKYDQARSNVDAIVTDVKHQGHAMLDVAQDSVATLEDVVHERPISAIAVAVGVGFLLGATWRR